MTSWSVINLNALNNFGPYRSRKRLDSDAIPSRVVDKIIFDARSEFGDSLVAILFVGSRIDGSWRPASDLDIHIIHSGAWQQKRIISERHTDFGFPLEISIDPLYPLYLWVQTYRAYAHFFALGEIVFPANIPYEIQLVIKAAKRFYESPKQQRFDTEEHHADYQKCLSILNRAVLEAKNDQSASLMQVLSAIMLLRLSLSGEYYPIHHKLATQIRKLDPDFADHLDACLCETNVNRSLLMARELLKLVKPAADSFIGKRS